MEDTALLQQFRINAMFERRKVVLDGEYAKAVLGKLYQLAERRK
jgi:hypothetical protein